MGLCRKLPRDQDHVQAQGGPQLLHGGQKLSQEAAISESECPKGQTFAVFYDSQSKMAQNVSNLMGSITDTMFSVVLNMRLVNFLYVS